MSPLLRMITLLALIVPLTTGYGKAQVETPEHTKKSEPLIPKHTFPPPVSSEKKSASLKIYFEGLGLQKQKKLKPAIEKWKAALRLDPQNVKCLNHYAWFKAVTAPKEHLDLNHALVLAQQAAQASHLTDHDVLDTVAEIHYHRKEYAKAVAVQKKALACRPISRRKRGYLNTQLKKFETALKKQSEASQAKIPLEKK